MKDFTPTKETISLHGLGFIQLKLNEKQRLHVWHPELPRRKCFEHSAVHNHRFSFTSTVLKGIQRNQIVDVELAGKTEGECLVISHNGPRSVKGGRLSFEVAECNLHYYPETIIEAGESYYMPKYGYHHTPNGGVVITLMTKLEEGSIHANSIIRKGVEFDQDFDRFQLPPEKLYEYVVAAFES